jgi:putative endonuclease
MTYYVCVIESLVDGTFYKGFSENPMRRLDEHNRGDAKYTSTKTPWKLVYVEECATKSDALKREKNIKKSDRKRLLEMIKTNKNLIANFQ